MEKKKDTLVADKLTIGYTTKTVASAINFSIQAGELCATVGINGIGKSTLLRTLGLLQPKLEGSIQLFGEELTHYNPAKRSKLISLVLTEPVASRNLTVEELIALGRQPYTNWMGALTASDKAKIQESITSFELERLRHQKCHQLSDGQLQRVLIARAMAQDTPIILLDEPTTHLDLFHKVSIVKSLRKLAHDHQKTILFTTHEIDLAIQLCDKILILKGTENPFGTPEQLIEQKHFEQMFPKDIVEFDAKSRAFKVNK